MSWAMKRAGKDADGSVYVVRREVYAYYTEAHVRRRSICSEVYGLHRVIASPLFCF